MGSGTPRTEATELIGINEKVPSQNEKGGLAKRPPNSLQSSRTTAADSSGDEGDFGNSWKRIDRSNRQLNEETVPPTKSGIFTTAAEKLRGPRFGS